MKTRSLGSFKSCILIHHRSIPVYCCYKFSPSLTCCIPLLLKQWKTKDNLHLDRGIVYIYVHIAYRSLAKEYICSSGRIKSFVSKICGCLHSHGPITSDLSWKTQISRELGAYMSSACAQVCGCEPLNAHLNFSMVKVSALHPPIFWECIQQYTLHCHV